MKCSYAVAAILLAGSASASFTEDLFPRQSENMLAEIPPACITTCQPMVELQADCFNNANRPQCVLCTPSGLSTIDTCGTCIVQELTNPLGANLDRGVVQSSIDAAKEAFLGACREAGLDVPATGASSPGSATPGTTGGSATPVMTSESTMITGTSTSAGTTVGGSITTGTADEAAKNTALANGASNTTGTTSNQGSDAIRAEFAASALVAIVAGAAFLV